jgi:hypothetical protein
MEMILVTHYVHLAAAVNCVIWRNNFFLLVESTETYMLRVKCIFEH